MVHARERMESIPWWVWVALVAITVFAASFYVYQNLLAPTSHVVNNVLVITQGNVKPAIASVLFPRDIVLHLYAENATDTSLACLAAAAAECSSGLSSSGKNVTVQGLVADEYCVNEAKNVTPCLSSRVLVRKGNCNCIRVEQSTPRIIIEGNDVWLCENAARIRDILRWSLSP